MLKRHTRDIQETLDIKNGKKHECPSSCEMIHEEALKVEPARGVGYCEPQKVRCGKNICH
jgi:hypothetical protein